MLRSCCRCGKEFQSLDRQLVCNACRVIRSPEKISFRESQVIELVKHGKGNKEIAHALHLTEGTVKQYLRDIYEKLGMENRTALAVWAMQNPTLEIPETKPC